MTKFYDSQNQTVLLGRGGEGAVFEVNGKTNSFRPARLNHRARYPAYPPLVIINEKLYLQERK